MGRLAGRNAAIYIDVAGGGAASPINFFNKFTIDSNVDQYDVTAFQDQNKVKVAGLPDAAGQASGFYDDATAQTYTASRDGLARKTYFYPNTSTPTQYFHCTAFWDFSLDVGVAQGEAITAKWAASSNLVKVG